GINVDLDDAHVGVILVLRYPLRIDHGFGSCVAIVGHTVLPPACDEIGIRRAPAHVNSMSCAFHQSGVRLMLSHNIRAQTELQSVRSPNPQVWGRIPRSEWAHYVPAGHGA